MTPRQIVEALDRYVVGQDDAKRAVAVAIRNRWRRSKLPDELRREVTPRNIILSGPTGVGKTEVARRLAQLVHAPFVKVEATKFTEVGYHGRDVESIVRDLADRAFQVVKQEQAQVVADKAKTLASWRLVDLLMPDPGVEAPAPPRDLDRHDAADTPDPAAERRARARQRMREQIESGKLDDREVELSVTRKPATGGLLAQMGVDQVDPDLVAMFERMAPEKKQRKRVRVAEARRILIEEETEKLLDEERLASDAVDRAEQSGIVFLDEIDKVAAPASGSGGRSGPDVSRQGVQRDLLPIVEGATVSTRYGPVRTDHVLFIAAGAFHTAKVTDLMPELQGRFPIRVELTPLTRDDLLRVLTEPRNALTRQQAALLDAEGLDVVFEDAAVEAMAELAAQANAKLENIGARRLITIVERVFEEVGFDAPDRVARGERKLSVTAEMVREKVGPIVGDADAARFVL
ncbi:MAG: ATP-dependent protease ATPase subunit HslU [Planctomycetota bacterium]